MCIRDSFRTAERELAALPPDVKVIVVDMHAEATSEKQAMGWHLDGRVSAVLGTHTHVATADNRVLPGGTAYITDVGMTLSLIHILRDDKGAFRLDANTHYGLFSAYYFLDDWSQNNPYPVAQGGANVPGFNALYTGRAQLLDLGFTKTLGASAARCV